MLRVLLVILWCVRMAVRCVSVIAVLCVLAVLAMNRASRQFVGTFHPRF